MEIVGFGLFYFLGRSDTTAPQAQPQTEQPDSNNVLPDIEVEVPSPPDVDINLPEVNGSQDSSDGAQSETQSEPSQGDDNTQSDSAPEKQGDTAQ
ncbi:MAG: hypothetical protein AAFW84_14105 [Cyanobacteria bacterium J06635_15]